MNRYEQVRSEDICLNDVCVENGLFISEMTFEKMKAKAGDRELYAMKHGVGCCAKNYSENKSLETQVIFRAHSDVDEYEYMDWIGAAFDWQKEEWML